MHTGICLATTSGHRSISGLTTVSDLSDLLHLSTIALVLVAGVLLVITSIGTCCFFRFSSENASLFLPRSNLSLFALFEDFLSMLDFPGVLLVDLGDGLSLVEVQAVL